MAAVFLCIVICLLTCSSAYHNLALNKPAHEEYPYNDVNTSASKAVDGLKSDLRGRAGQCSLSAANQPNSTWWVNLTGICSIHDIQIYYRTDHVIWDPQNGYTARFLGFSIYVSNTTNKSDGELCYKDRNFTRSTIPAVFNTTCFVHGQYVIYYNERLPGVIYPSGYSKYAFNDLCEVEVYGCPTPGYYGINCTIPCPDVNCRYCHIETGTCQGGCKPGYKGHQCELECDNREYGDGCQGKCGHCLNMTQCDHINGTFLQGCEAGYKGQLCDKECGVGFYGQGCTSQCGNCSDQTDCSRINGTCLKGCLPGYRGDMCNEQCTASFFGPNCQEKCNATCLSCNIFTGVCDKGCHLGWKGNYCQYECDGNMYGENCSKSCGNCKNSQQCHHIDGTCMNGCENGYQGSKCDKECDDYRYGKNCSRQCGHCFNNSSCYHINGTCVDGCDRGYQGTECMQQCSNNTFGRNCQQKCKRTCITCDIVTGICDSGCHPGWKGDYCENACDGNFYGANCSLQCGKCMNNEQCHSAYGHCKSGCASGFTGTNCDTECSDGYFGPNCLESCNETCNSCNKTSGVCEYGCEPGWKGDFCETVCDGHFYGENCSVPCGDCFENKQCHHLNGTCLTGCMSGFMGSECVEECEDGYFGENCIRECHSTCNSCNKSSGICDLGCHPGWKGPYCTEECDGGLFWVNCSTPCGHCLNNQQCHHINGTCANGCDPGYIGDNCTKECNDYKYGENCSFSCGNCEDNEKCNHVDGTCMNTCDKGYQGPKCDAECDDYRYGKNCSRQCGHCFNNSSCHHINGTCVDGCDRGYQGTECMDKCSNNRFGRNCQQKCNRTCITCNIVTGICDRGCHPGWKGDYCENACDGNFYGANCSLLCGKCLNNEKCHPAYGYCESGCASGFNGTNCDTECPDGYFGPNCLESCNETCKSCNKTSGVCEYGCEPGWKGDFCETICDDHFYGENCSVPCGNCFKNKQCHHLNGTCFNGCMSGFMGSECVEECEDGYFGENCIRDCPVYCNSCNKRSGVCDLGCHPGWKGTYCTEECDGGLFGMNCSIMCGSCHNNQQCHHINGTCVDGCDPGYMGGNCTEDCRTGTFGLNCNTSCSINCINSDNCNPKTGDCIGGCKDGMKGAHCNEKCNNNMFGKNCTHMCGNCINSTQCHHVNGSCPSGCGLGFQSQLCNKECKNGRFGYNCLQNCSSLCVNATCDKKYGSCEKIATQTSDSDNNSPFTGVGVGLLIILIASVLVFIIVRRYRKSSPNAQPVNNNGKEDEMRFTGQSKSKINTPSSSNGRPAIETTPLNDGINGMIAEYPECFNVTKTSPDIAIDKLEAVIAEKGKNENEGFRKEYAALPSGELHKCEFGKKPENVPKNRYKTTFPYDHSRVVLDTRGGEKSDYIHANYIEGPNRKKEYIATQGPKPNTLGDFWRMIWQERVTTIVMVTNLKEGEKLKCNKYWPDKDKPKTYGPALVTLLEEKEYAFYTTRQFSVYNKELKNTRIVTQYHYTAWPDHGVPEPLGLITFHNHVINTSANNIQGPTTVHCSAGVGRTGTYIALDALYQIGMRKGKVNVAEFVAKMRQNRVSMVQTYEQYITIFLALNEIFKAPIKVDSMAEFSSKADKAGKNIPANQNPGRKEFQLLLKIRPIYTKDDYKFAINSLGDKGADEIMPLDKYSLHLSTGIPKRGSYINAITAPSFTNSQGFIVTKYPPPEDAVDLLRLLNDHESDTVISLQPLRYIESSSAWFPAVSSSLKIPPYTVTHQSESHTDVISHVIQIHKEGDDNHTVMVIEPDAEIHCSGNSSVDTSYLRSLVSTVLDIETKKPITILSSDGASLCGLFIAVHNVIQQMNMDDRVDVFTAVRQLQIRRPEFCARLEEYEMIYRAVLDYNQRESENIYCNQ